MEAIEQAVNSFWDNYVRVAEDTILDQVEYTGTIYRISDREDAKKAACKQLREAIGGKQCMN